MAPGRTFEPPAHDMLPPHEQLRGLQAEFPCFKIWREHTCDRVRYIARSLHPGLNPHTVVTDDIDELRAALGPSQHAACPGTHAAGQRMALLTARPLPTLSP
jgi:hypothetical protein